MTLSVLKLLFLCLSLLISLSSCSINSGAVNGPNRRLRPNCTISTNKATWLLKWEEDFTGDLSQWKVEEEGAYCSGNSEEAASCNVKENAFTLNGALVLVAKHGPPHYTTPYTGARVTSPHMFPPTVKPTNALIQVRAALPLGTQLYASIFAISEREQNPIDWSYTWLELVTNTGRSFIKHGAHYNRRSATYSSKELSVSKDYEKSINLNRFQSYGVLWSEPDEIRLIFNRHITEAYVRGGSNPPDYRLLLTVGVGGANFPQPLPVDFSHLKWICPALIVDSVRVFEKIDVSEARKYGVCSFDEEDKVADEKLDGICKIALEHSLGIEVGVAEGTGTNFTLIILLVIVLLLGLLALVYYLVQSGRLTRGPSGPGGSYQRNNEDFLFGYSRQNDSAPSGETGAAADGGATNGAFDGRLN